jgi:hypothetical protein
LASNFGENTPSFWVVKSGFKRVEYENTPPVFRGKAKGEKPA